MRAPMYMLSHGQQEEFENQWAQSLPGRHRNLFMASVCASLKNRRGSCGAPLSAELLSRLHWQSGHA